MLQLDLSLCIRQDMGLVIVVFLKAIFEPTDWLAQFTDVNGCCSCEFMEVINQILQLVCEVIRRCYLRFKLHDALLLLLLLFF